MSLGRRRIHRGGTRWWQFLRELRSRVGVSGRYVPELLPRAAYISLGSV